MAANAPALGSTWLSVCTKAAGFYYYYPGWHEPGTGIAIGINKGVWERFNAERPAAHRGCGRCEYARSLAESDINNARALRKLRDEGTVKILKFDNSVLKAVLAISKDVVAEIGSGDELSKKIYASYQQFRTLITDWNAVSARDYLSSRGPA